MRRILSLALVLGLLGSVGWAGTTPRHGLNQTGNADQNDTLKILDRVVPPSKNGRPIMSAVFCGQLANAVLDYLGPVEVQDASAGGEGLAGPIDAGSTVCNAADSTTEATADAPIFTNTTIYPLGMYCRAVTDAGATGSGTLGVEFALRVNAAAPSTALSCRVETGQIDCAAWYDKDTDLPAVAGAVPMDVRATPGAEDLSANDGWCRVFFTF